MKRYQSITIRFLEPGQVEKFQQKGIGDYFLLRYEGPVLIITDQYGTERHIPIGIVGDVSAVPEPTARW